jgi:uncharacterized protein YkwD
LNYFDAILILIILIPAVFCYKKGLIQSLLILVGWGGALILAVIFYPDMAQWLKLNFFIQQQWLNPLAFLLLLLAGLLFFYVTGAWLNKRIPAQVHGKAGIKIAGVLPGIVLGWCGALLITKVAQMSTVSDVQEQAEESFFASQTDNQMAWAAANFTAIFETPVNEKIAAALEAEADVPHDATIAVAGSEAFKNSNYVPRPDLERQMLQLVNAERTKLGIKPLQADGKAREVGALHAADMFVRGYFSHNSPEGTDPFMRMKQSGVRYKTAGENLAYATTLPLAHRGLMNSPGHRKNILNPRFGRVGVAILDGGKKGLMFVQVFRD